ncbi:hypothetical protein BDV93DRAFT_608556 [Ceratobasidium sp. AG-I]|nr:hypothetical protein BDV93DRAFT_608556 [Ceratobasidium sp. AG-I]
MVKCTLNIYSYGLTQNTTLVFLFQTSRSSDTFLYEYPVVWKAKTFGAQAHSKATIRFESRIGFGYSTIDKKGVVKVSGWTEAKSGETTWSEEGPEVEHLGPGLWGQATELGSKNTTETRANLTFGVVHGDGDRQTFEPIHVWTGIGTKSTVTTHFTPTVAVHVARNYKESQKLSEEFETDPIWEFNIEQFRGETGWNLIENKDTGDVSIQRAKQI